MEKTSKDAHATEKRKHLTMKQPLMRRMMIATTPCILASVYFFGWRCLIVVLVSCAAAFITEWFFSRRLREPVSEAVFVSGILYALVMPPTVPWHVLVIGIVFAVVFGKMVFGGFGKNIFNPALVGRAFVYICFPVALTAIWSAPAQGLWGALGQWTTVTGVDAIASATPMALVKAGQAGVPPLSVLFFGRIAGTMGVTSVLAILIGGLFVFFTKTANRIIIITVIGTYAACNLLFSLLGVAGSPGMLPALFGGGFLFGAFFMATDPVSAPKTTPAKIVFSVIIGVCTIIIRTFSVFNGGLMFSILIANMFAPILDHAFVMRKKKMQHRRQETGS
jgi:Na+-transporting NADH:ubiquinone oxidoreductase subunit B